MIELFETLLSILNIITKFLDFIDIFYKTGNTYK